ncbi:MAG: hypothetical protein ACI3XF_03965 [Eubacteriales bacterium]
MKKIISLLLIISMLALVFVSCGKAKNPEDTTSSSATTESTTATTQKPVEIKNTDYDVEDLMNKVLEDMGGKVTIIDESSGEEFELRLTGPTHFNASSKDESNYYTGLDASLSLVEEDAVYNENMMMGGTPFSMVIIKLKDSKDADKVKEEMFNGINMQKWICRSADHLITVDNGNYVLLVMSSQDVCEKVANSFDNVLEEVSGTRLAKNFG